VYNNCGQLAGQLAPLGSLLEKLCKLELENEPGPGGFIWVHWLAVPKPAWLAIAAQVLSG